MKTVLTIVTAILFYGCSDIWVLNEKIYEAQLKTINQSPYKSAAGTSVYVENQKNFRLNYLPKLIKDKLKESATLNDTLWMTESFDAICLNCPSYVMKVLLRDTVYTINREVLGHKGGVTYTVETKPLQQHYKDFQLEANYSNLIEVALKIRAGQPWNMNPLQYGDDNCNDGDHTIATVIYPNKKIEVLYVRCWLPLSFRSRN
jgi:hypothetical protein